MLDVLAPGPRRAGDDAVPGRISAHESEPGKSPRQAAARWATATLEDLGSVAGEPILNSSTLNCRRRIAVVVH